jgi:hypothetical protein
VRHDGAALRQPHPDHLRPVPGRHHASRRSLLVQRLPRLARRRVPLAGYGVCRSRLPPRQARRVLADLGPLLGHRGHAGGQHLARRHRDLPRGIIVRPCASPRGRAERRGVPDLPRNSRFPDILRGDIRAVLAGCQPASAASWSYSIASGRDGAGGPGRSSRRSAATPSARRWSRAFPTAPTRARTR